MCLLLEISLFFVHLIQLIPFLCSIKNKKQNQKNNQNKNRVFKIYYSFNNSRILELEHNLYFSYQHHKNTFGILSDDFKLHLLKILNIFAFVCFKQFHKLSAKYLMNCVNIVLAWLRILFQVYWSADNSCHWPSFWN